MSTSKDGSKLCVSCGEQLGVIFCYRCCGARYCSAKCQQHDWTIHQLLCSHFYNIVDRPEGGKRAILFPHDEEVPRFVWIVPPKCDVRHIRTSACGYLNCSKSLKLSGASSGHRVNFLQWDDIRVNGGPVNRSITAILQKQGIPRTHDWRGPVLLMRNDSEDMTLSDFSQAVIIFRYELDLYDLHGDIFEAGLKALRMSFDAGKSDTGLPALISMNCSTPDTSDTGVAASSLMVSTPDTSDTALPTSSLMSSTPDTSDVGLEDFRFLNTTPDVIDGIGDGIFETMERAIKLYVN